MKTIIIPQNIFVGDTAYFLYHLSEKEISECNQRHIELDLPLPLHTITQHEMMSVQEIRMIQRDTNFYLQIIFVPWETGEITFPIIPALSFIRTFPSVHVSSLITDTANISLQPPKPPLLLPGTDYLLYGAAVTGIGSLLLLGAGFWVLLRRFGKRPRHIARKRLSVLKKQLRLLHKEARHIQKMIAHEQAAAVWNWYAAVDRTLRDYLQSLFLEDGTIGAQYREAYFASATYTELTQALAAVFTSQHTILDLFTIVYTRLEQQRFASNAEQVVRDYTAVWQDMLKKIPYIAAKTEAAYTALRQSRAESVTDTPS